MLNNPCWVGAGLGCRAGAPVGGLGTPSLLPPWSRTKGFLLVSEVYSSAFLSLVSHRDLAHPKL